MVDIRVTAWDSTLLIIFAEALARSGEDDATAETLLNRLAKSSAEGLVSMKDLITIKVLLSRVLRRCRKTNAAAKEEKWLVKWFRKNPHLIDDSTLRRLLMPAGEAPSPILESLGGPSWLDGREHTDKTDYRLSKFCSKCFAREPIVKLSLCSRCKRLYYWCDIGSV
ncbi:uncharacterized protein B0H18DRAFT_880995 [Fomitopsis serialis]|uniref:uncharacterized protein n=1 Tax=Fomitopsis serialis TaxID=139415 RepID=UPI002008BF9C|nr:uncharacterized protein B0H18DRAFT_880995 [Neoantrodia serialis]KAH9920634.1 hypothetical protein B0H18DRAFT_880995 [Neoantrodia serialis]